MDSRDSQKIEFSIEKILQSESCNNLEEKCDIKLNSFPNANVELQNGFQNKYFPEPDQSAFYLFNHINDHTNLQNRINIQNAFTMCFPQYDQFIFKDLQKHLQEYQHSYAGVPVYYSYTSDFENKRKGGQIRFTAFQTKKLEQYFSTSKYLAPEERKRLAEQIKLSGRQVKTWFQNRRAKWRRSYEYRRTSSPHPQLQTNTNKKS